MIKKYLLITLAAFLLAACGGSDDKPLFPETDGSLGGSTDRGGGTDSGSDTDGDTDVDGAEESVLVKLGAHSGVDFKEGVIQASLFNFPETAEIDLKASIVNPANGNAFSKEEFGVAFSSTCSAAVKGGKASDSFTPAEIKSVKNGRIETKYNASSCAATGTTEDQLTVTIYKLNGAEINYNLPVATALVNIQIDKPSAEAEIKLGSYTGADFKEGVIDASATLISYTDSTVLKASVVNPVNNNGYSSNSFGAVFASTCSGKASDSFTPAEEIVNNGQIETTYQASGCASDTVTEDKVELTIYKLNSNGTIDRTSPLASATVDIKFDTPSAEAKIQLGASSLNTFKEGVIAASEYYVSRTSVVDLNASIVNPEFGNNYSNKEFGTAFTSSCSTDAGSSFTNPGSIVSNGQISTQYMASGCPSDEDVFTLTIYNLNGTEINYTAPVATATVTIYIENPSLEDEFKDNVATLGVNPSVITAGATSTITAFEKANDGGLSQQNYQTEITSTCGASAQFTTSPATINDGTYTAVFDSGTCAGKQTITLTLKDSVGEMIGTAQGDIEILDAQLEALAVSAPMATLAIGETTQITSNIVDSNGQVVTNANYMVRYTSSCTSGSFSSNETVVKGGVAAQYKARFCAGGTDTVTFTLFPLNDEGEVLEELELDAKTIDVSITDPEIGYLSSGVFTPGIKGKSNIKARESVELSAIVAGTEVGGVKRRITSTDFYAELISSCGADFERESELTQKGVFTMLYNPNDCRVEDTVTVNLYDIDDKNEAIYTDLVATTTFTIAIENPHIGYIDGTDFKSGEITPVPAQLSAGGTVNLEAIIADGNDVTAAKLTDSRYAVSFTSKCAEDQPVKAGFSHEQKIIRDGNVTVQYTAMGCLGQDDVTFKLYSVDSEGNVDSQNVLHEAVVSIDIAEQELSNIAYLSDGVDQLLAIKGIANNNLPNSSKLAFKVTDKNGDPIPNKTVEFELSKTSGGVALTWDEATTNDEGVVETTINSGTAHAVVSVKASIYKDGDNTNITPGNILSTYSLPFTITTGLPQQYGFEISADVFNPPAYNVNGSIVNVSVIAYDMWGNPVPDGTAVNFIAESGAIEPSCTTVGGNCSVKWQSGGQRPGQTDLEYNFKNEIDPLTGESLKGMTTILAYTEGEAGFNDSNANGQYDDLESTKYFPEAFLNSDWSLDGNNEHAWNDHEFVDYNNDETYTAAPTTYQGAVCSDSAKGAGHCESLMHVRSQIRIMQSMKDSIAMRIFENCGADYMGCTEVSAHTLDPAGGLFWVVLQDGNGNMPASGASLSVEPNGYKILGTPGNVSNSIGELGVSLFSPLNPYTWDLPPYGQLYEVQYVPEADPKDITLTAQSGEAKRSALFTQ